MGSHSHTLDEVLLHALLLLSNFLALASFYFTSSYSTMLRIYFVGAVGVLVIAVPDYTFFNRSPRSWGQPVGDEAPVTQALVRVKHAHASSQDVPFQLSSFPCFPYSAASSSEANDKERCIL